jgi:hypothetical protein
MKGRRRSQRGSKKRAKRRWGETTCVVHGSECDSELARRPRLLPVRTRAVTLARRSRAHARRSRRASSLVGPACCLRRSPVHVGAGAHLCALEPSRSHTGAKLSPAGAVVCSHATAAHSPITAARRPALTLHCRMLARSHRARRRKAVARSPADVTCARLGRWTRCGRPPEQLRSPACDALA